jgi:uncharacterized protein YgiM (DUF1202 family)
MKKTRKLLVLFLAIAMTVSMLAFPAIADGSIAYGAATVSASTLNIRSGPSTSYSIAGTVSRNSKVVVLEKTSSSWYRINYKGTKGYVSADYLKNVVKAENFDATGSVTGSNCRMRSQPNTSSSVLGTYSSGTKMSVIGINNGWYKVQYSGKTGYMRSDLMEIVSGSGSTTTTEPAPSQPEEPVQEKESLTSVDADYGIVNGSGCRTLMIVIHGNKFVFDMVFSCILSFRNIKRILRFSLAFLINKAITYFSKFGRSYARCNKFLICSVIC